METNEDGLTAWLGWDWVEGSNVDAGTNPASNCVGPQSGGSCASGFPFAPNWWEIGVGSEFSPDSFPLWSGTTSMSSRSCQNSRDAYQLRRVREATALAHLDS